MESFNLDLLIDDYIQDDVCSDNSVDEEELNNFLMGDVLPGIKKKSKKMSYSDRFMMKLMKKRGIKYNRRKKKRKRRKNASYATNMTPELEKLMQDATDCYLDKKIDEAVKILKELVRRAPGLHDPFHMLGLIYQEEYNDLNTAASYYLLAVHLVPTDIDLWQRIGEMSQEIGNIDQAIYCFKKCLKDHYNNINEQVYFSLAICYIEKEDYGNAVRRLSVLYKMHQEDILLAIELSKCLDKMGDYNSSLMILINCYKLTYDNDLLLRICKLQISLELYNDCYELLSYIKETNNLSIELLVYYVMSSANLNKNIKDELEILWNNKLNNEIIFKISNSLINYSIDECIKWFKYGFDNIDNPIELDHNIAIKITKLIIKHENNYQYPIKVLKYLLDIQPKNTELLLTLADILNEYGDVDQAEEILSNITLDEFDKVNQFTPTYVYTKQTNPCSIQLSSTWRGALST